MGYPQQVPPGWTRGEPVSAWGTGPRYAIGRDIQPFDFRDAKVDEDFLVTFDSREEAEAWLKWWKSPTSGGGNP